MKRVQLILNSIECSIGDIAPLKKMRQKQGLVGYGWKLFGESEKRKEGLESKNIGFVWWRYQPIKNVDKFYLEYNKKKN